VCVTSTTAIRLRRPSAIKPPLWCYAYLDAMQAAGETLVQAFQAAFRQCNLNGSRGGDVDTLFFGEAAILYVSMNTWRCCLASKGG
jgi:hypothetical protein